MHVHGPGPAVEVVAPHLPQQRGTGEHPSGPGGQEPQQLELLVGEVEGPSVNGDLIGVGGQGQPTQADRALGGPARPASEHGQANLHLRRGSVGIQQVVGYPIPPEPVEIAAMDDCHKRDLPARGH